MSAVCTLLDVTRSSIATCIASCLYKHLGTPLQPDDYLLGAIKAVIADMPNCGYRRVHAILYREAPAAREPLLNLKRVYRMMKVHGALLQRHAGDPNGRRHDGRVAVDRSSLRWCSDRFEISCDNGEKVCIALALDCCNRETSASSRPPRASRARTSRISCSWPRRPASAA